MQITARAQNINVCTCIFVARPSPRVFVYTRARVFLAFLRSIKGKGEGREITRLHPVQNSLTLADERIWVRLNLRKEPEHLAAAETDEMSGGTRDTGRC